MTGMQPGARHPSPSSTHGAASNAPPAAMASPSHTGQHPSGQGTAKPKTKTGTRHRRVLPPAPFVWLVATFVPVEPPQPLPVSVDAGPGRVLVESHGRHVGSVWTVAGEEGRFPTAYRDKAMDTWIGADRGPLFTQPSARESALFRCVDALCEGLDPLRSGGAIEYDSPVTHLTLRDGLAWVNGPRQWPPCLPSLGGFYPEDQPPGLVALLGEGWSPHDIGLVMIEMPSRSAHHRLALRRRLAADLAAADIWRAGWGSAPAPFFLVEG